MEIIKSNQNSSVKHIKKLFLDKKYRKSCGLIACEGKTMLLEAINQGIEIDIVLCTEEEFINLPHVECKVLVVESKIIKEISDTKTPQGIIFSCKLKTYDLKNIKNCRQVIILDNVRDPGNMGTIIRSANAFFVDAIILTGDCVDIKSPKVIRASMGEIFKIPLYSLTYDEVFENLTHLRIYATALSKDSKSVLDVSLKSSAVIIGNEANGVSSELIKKADNKIIIPINPATESLNASIASSIIMWEMSKGRN